MTVEYWGIDADGNKFHGYIKSKSKKVKNFWHKTPESKWAKKPFLDFGCRLHTDN